MAVDCPDRRVLPPPRPIAQHAIPQGFFASIQCSPFPGMGLREQSKQQREKIKSGMQVVIPLLHTTFVT